MMPEAATLPSLPRPVRVYGKGWWMYHPAPEEIPVTFQIGLVADDGVILASDKRARSRAGVAEGRLGVDISSTVEKLWIVDRAFAYCVAGNENTIHSIARGIRVRLEGKGGKLNREELERVL